MILFDGPQVSRVTEDLAAPQGFEPRYSAPEADVLPLNEGAAGELTGETRHRFDSMGCNVSGQEPSQTPQSPQQNGLP
jgi:hypothetical protein